MIAHCISCRRGGGCGGASLAGYYRFGRTRQGLHDQAVEADQASDCWCRGGTLNLAPGRSPSEYLFKC